ncbi:MAG: DUF3850 domain-containing protein [candidate division Zixibacteria bacterium]|nr:DUF3850 domain-containing protein [candidate division Zixibacteria bacterium]
MKHELKTDQLTFLHSFAGTKPWEIRLNDKDFRVGDILLLRETVYSGQEMKDGKPLEYTGRELMRRIDYILDGYGLNENLVVMTVSKF